MSLARHATAICTQYVLEYLTTQEYEEKVKNFIHTKLQTVLGPVAPSWFSTELNQVGRHELVHDDCALHHF